MFNLRSVARILLAGIFIAGGWDSLQDPKAKEGAAEKAGVPIAARVGLPTDPVELVRINGIVQLVGGILLALGWLPRLASVALAATLVPTTASAHRFWEFDDPDQRRAQLMHALKNASILGGLIMTSLDHGGRPSVFWVTGRAARRTGDALSGAMEKVAG